MAPVKLSPRKAPVKLSPRKQDSYQKFWLSLEASAKKVIMQTKRHRILQSCPKLLCL